MTIEGGRDTHSEFSSAAHRENWKDCAVSRSWIRQSSNKELHSVECCMFLFHALILAPAFSHHQQSKVLQTRSQTYRELVATAIDCRRPACNWYSAFSMTDYSSSLMYHAEIIDIPIRVAR